jgi:hypothetical protein
MTDSDTTQAGAETWKPIPGYPAYEASDCGRVRSIPRTEHGRTYRSVVLSTRVSNSGYVLVNVRDADGERQTRTVHTLVLAAFTGPRPRGQEARHLNDDPVDNRAENLVWGTKAENVADTFANGRARAVPPAPKVCVRCSNEFEGPGRRCHPCVVELGERFARLLAAGVPLDQAAERLDYPSQSGGLVLAQKYGGLRLTLAPEPAPSRSAHGPLATLRHRLRRGHHQ